MNSFSEAKNNSNIYEKQFLCKFSYIEEEDNNINPIIKRGKFKFKIKDGLVDPMDKSGTSDAYVKVCYNDKKIYETQVVMKDLSPEWNETFEFEIENELRFEVYDWNMIQSHKQIGEGGILLHQIKDNKKETKTVTLINKNKLKRSGYIHLDVEFIPKEKVVPIHKDFKDNEDGDLVISLYDFKGIKKEELDIHQNDFLRVTDWNVKEGWVYGYKSGCMEKKGLFPKVFITLFNEKGKQISYIQIYFIFKYFII